MMYQALKSLTYGAVFAGLVASGTAFAQDGDKVDFGKDIWPFLKASCAECHQPPHPDPRRPTRIKKPKGDFVLTSKEAITAGVTDEDEPHSVITAGKPDDSSLYTTTTKPLYDDLHMPPPDSETVAADEELTDDQKALLKKWIEQGADFGTWTEDPEFKAAE